MKRLLIILSFSLLFTSCATQQMVTGAGGYAYLPETDKVTRVEIPVPHGWYWRQSGRLPDAVYVVKSPDHNVELSVMLLPNDQRASSPAERMRQVTKRSLRDNPFPIRQFETTIGGRQALGLEIDMGRECLGWFFVDDDANGVYAIHLHVAAHASRSQVDAAGYMFANLRFVKK